LGSCFCVYVGCWLVGCWLVGFWMFGTVCCGRKADVSLGVVYSAGMDVSGVIFRFGVHPQAVGVVGGWRR
jgi:hypothetical protein